MRTVGRKVYMHWGNKVVAVEILAETPEQFEQRTHIHLEEDISVVCEIRDIFGERTERTVGTILDEPCHSAKQGMSEFFSSVKLITQEDISDLSRSCGISKGCVHSPLEFNNEYAQDIDSWHEGFEGFIELPNKQEHSILYSYNKLSHITQETVDKRLYIPVFVNETRRAFFDDPHETAELIDAKPWVVLFLGNDNCSYGYRFETKDKAMNYLKAGFEVGLPTHPKLYFYNS